MGVSVTDLPDNDFGEIANLKFDDDEKETGEEEKTQKPSNKRIAESANAIRQAKLDKNTKTTA
jgi:hypothetical protein